MNRARRQRGMSLVETAIALLITAISTMACLTAATTAARTAEIANDVRDASMWADGMLEYLALLPYADPTTPTAGIGADSGESTTDAFAWDDVDDANGWSGTPIGCTDSTWTMTIAIARVRLSNPALTSVSDEGLKRITINVLHRNRPLITRVMVVTRR